MTRMGGISGSGDVHVAHTVERQNTNKMKCQYPICQKSILPWIHRKTVLHTATMRMNLLKKMQTVGSKKESRKKAKRKKLSQKETSLEHACIYIHAIVCCVVLGPAQVVI